MWYVVYNYCINLRSKTTAKIYTSKPANKFAQPNGMSKISFD